MRSRFLLLALALCGLAPPARAAAPPRPRPPEGLRMLLTILAGKPMGPGGGWFGPSQTAYDWNWLAGRFDADRDGAITPAEFRGPKATFTRLDRDGDGKLTRADLDFTPRMSANPRDRMIDMLVQRADRDRDGRLSAKEWQGLFEQAAGDKGELTREDLRRLLMPPQTAGRPAKGARGGGPSRWTLLKGVFSGEVGSLCEGPALGEDAPAFTLRTHDGKRTVSLTDYKDKKPVVLVFGSFT